MNKFEYKNLTPFKWFVLENFPFIEADFDALTEWQLFCKLEKEMNKIITSENTLGTQVENVTNAFIELQNYVNNYFDNLNIQDEVNIKLNEMAESGELAEIMSQFILPSYTYSYNNVESMKNDNTLANGMRVLTFGYYNANDGGNAKYIISNENLVSDNQFVIALNNGLYAKLIIENNTINIKQLGAQNNEDITAILQNALMKQDNQAIYIPAGRYLISDSVINNLNNKNVEIYGDNDTILVNNMSDLTSETVKPLIGINCNNLGNWNNGTQIGVTTSEVASLSNVINISANLDLSVGDMLVFGTSTLAIAKIKSINDLEITLDREIPNDIPLNTPIYRINNNIKIDIHNLKFDFNGTIENPRYGYGIIVYGASNVNIYDISAVNISSKVIQLSRCIDSLINNIYCENACDKNAGMGYVVRLSYAQNNKVENVIGLNTRHTVDLSASWNNIVESCKSYENVNGFGTHFNGCKYNKFINCYTERDTTSAYSFTPESNDLYNSVENSTIINCPIVRPNDNIIDKTNTFNNLKCITLNKHLLGNLLGDIVLNNCEFYIKGTGLIRNASDGVTSFTFNNCYIAIETTGNSHLAYGTGTNEQSMLFKDCIIEEKANCNNSIYLAGSSNTNVLLDNCQIKLNDLSGSGAFTRSGNITYKNCTISAPTARNYIHEFNTKSKLTLVNNTFINISYIYQLYQTNNQLTLGNNHFINSWTNTAFANLTSETIGLANLPPSYTSTPGGYWKENSKLIYDTLPSDNTIIIVYKNSAWNKVLSLQ